MPELKSVYDLYLVVGFLVPGLIATFVRAQFTTGRTAPHSEALLSFLVLSIVYYALTLPAVDYTLALRNNGACQLAAWFGLVFVGPALFGLFLGLNAQREWLRRLLQWCRLNPIHFMPTAWDWKFANIKPHWVLVVLKDGTKFAGYCGPGSFASSDPAERDLYIERIYDLDEQNEWHPRDNSVLIAAGEISTVEFWKA